MKQPLTRSSEACVADGRPILLFDESRLCVSSRGVDYPKATVVPWTDIRLGSRVMWRRFQYAWEDVAAGVGLSEDLKRVVLGEGISALSFIPIVAEGRVIGKFMTYYDRPHRFDERETDAAITIARQLGFGLERLKGEQTRNLLAAVVESSSDAIITKSLDGQIQSWNKGAQDIFGYTAVEAIGQPVTILFPPDRYDEEPEIIVNLGR